MKKHGNRLGLDIALKTGWAIKRYIGDLPRYDSGVWDFNNRAGDGAGIRFCRLEDALREIIKQYKITRVAYELPAVFRSRAASASVHGMVAVMQKVCEEKDIPYEGFPPTSVKKHATGKGKASKEQMIEAAKEKFLSQHIVDDNQADALWVLDISYGKNGYDD